MTNTTETKPLPTRTSGADGRYLVHFDDGVAFEMVGFQANETETLAELATFYRDEARAHVNLRAYTIAHRVGDHDETLTPDGFGYDNRDDAMVAASTIKRHAGIDAWTCFGRTEEYAERY